MKLFWKLFFGVICVTTMIFCVSGHLLITTVFRSSLEREETRLAQTNAAFATAFQTAAEKNYNGEWMDEREVENSVLSIRFSGMSDINQLIIRSPSKSILYRKTKQLPVPDDKLKDSVTEEKDTVYQIKKYGGRYYIHAVSAMSVGRWEYNVETMSEISSIFWQKEEQYRIFAVCMCSLVGVTAIIILFLAMWITSPLRKLSLAVQKIGHGDYTKKIMIRGDDEVTDLARKFNWMTEELEQTVGKLKEQAVRQEEFVGSFSHEMKTPLTSIIGYSDMIRSKPMTEEERILYGDCIYRQGKRLEKLSSRMLELIVLGKKDIKLQNVELKNFLGTIEEELKPVLTRRKISLKTRVDTCQILAEPALLKTVFLNIVDNSQKAVEEQGCIHIWSEKEEQRVWIHIWDNGKGIPAGEVERVTESFYMADKSRKYENGGVGLGLSICKKVLELHNAFMKIESTEGKETTVSICFKVQ